MDEKGKIARAAGSMSGATTISRVLGYARDMLLAFYFGATGLSDTFFVAFRVPNLLRELFAEGSMSAAFVPVLTEYESKDPAEAKRLVRITFFFLLAATGTICLLGIVFAPEIVTILGVGFLDDPEKFSRTVLLTRVMFPFLVFISLAALAMGALNVKRVFFVPALAPAMLNLTIIISVVSLVQVLPTPILAAAVGVAIGGLVQFAFQVPAFFRKGYSLAPAWQSGHPGLKKMLRLLLPVSLGMAVAQINIVVSTTLATLLREGSVTYLFYSMRLVQFPIGVFGVAMSMAALPSLSSHAVRKDFEALREDFSFALRLLFFISVPAMAGLIALREPIVNLLFQRGAFDHQATLGTAQALMFYSMGIWAFVGVRVVAVTFYSMQDTKTPVKAAVTALGANVLLSLALMGPLGHSGLALANALASMLNFTVLMVLLRKRLGRVEGRRILASFAKVALASAVMGVAAWLALRGDLWSRPGESLVKAAWVFGGIFASAALYAILGRLLRCEELDFIISRFIKRRESAN
ncbi:MAG: murein biosynthesis integral membrane protein MurJ [Nitrospirota bacterium]|jgi:putative peptidoglycan lipid II flippase